MADVVRSEFPGLRQTKMGEVPPILADGASGSQVHEILGDWFILRLCFEFEFFLGLVMGIASKDFNAYVLDYM